MAMMNGRLRLPIHEEQTSGSIASPRNNYCEKKKKKSSYIYMEGYRVCLNHLKVQKKRFFIKGGIFLLGLSLYVLIVDNNSLSLLQNHSNNILRIADSSTNVSNLNQERTTTALFQPTANSNGTYTLQNTIVTPHITSIVEIFTKCHKKTLQPTFNIFVKSASSTPIITAYKKNPVLRRNYQVAFQKRLFPPNTTRFLPPGNLSIGISGADKDNGPACAFSSSSPAGNYSVFNFQDVRWWAENRQSPPPLSWKERNTIPVFRGVGWSTLGYVQTIQKELDDNLKNGMSVKEAGDIFYNKFVHTNNHNQRFALMDFSLQHPDLVDARLSSVERLRAWHPKEMWKNNATNGLYRLFPVDPIPEEEYYTEYQVHVVMGGIGAAFRMARILKQAIAIILQEYPYEEWFTHIMVPYVHYIPLKEDLSNLKEILVWVRENPTKVYEIAENGKEFYEEYLSYERMEDFYHELLFRLMLCCGSQVK